MYIFTHIHSFMLGANDEDLWAQNIFSAYLSLWLAYLLKLQSIDPLQEIRMIASHETLSRYGDHKCRRKLCKWNKYT